MFDATIIPMGSKNDTKQISLTWLKDTLESECQSVASLLKAPDIDRSQKQLARETLARFFSLTLLLDEYINPSEDVPSVGDHSALIAQGLKALHTLDKLRLSLQSARSKTDYQSSDPRLIRYFRIIRIRSFIRKVFLRRVSSWATFPLNIERQLEWMADRIGLSEKPKPKEGETAKKSRLTERPLEDVEYIWGKIYRS